MIMGYLILTKKQENWLNFEESLGNSAWKTVSSPRVHLRALPLVMSK